MSDFTEQTNKVINGENLKKAGKFALKVTKNALIIGFLSQGANGLRIYLQGRINRSNEDIYKDFRKFKTFIKDVKLDKI